MLNNSPSPPKDSRPHTQGLLLLKICICISIGVWNLTILLDAGCPGHESLQFFMGEWVISCSGGILCNVVVCIRRTCAPAQTATPISKETLNKSSAAERRIFCPQAPGCGLKNGKYIQYSLIFQTLPGTKIFRRQLLSI